MQPPRFYQPATPTDIRLNTNHLQQIPSKQAGTKCLPKVLISIALIGLAAAAIVIPIVVKLYEGTTTTVSTSSTSTTTQTTTTTTSQTTTTTTTTVTTATTTTTTATTTTTTAGTTVCVTTAITTTVTSSPLPAQCSSYTTITDATRSAGNTVSGSVCDQSNPMTTSGAWYRFSGAAGTMLASCAVVINRCSTQASGWYSGVYPSAAGSTTTGNVCYNWSGNTCNWSNSISVTNCNGYYVFFLISPPVCNLRYCTV